MPDLKISKDKALIDIAYVHAFLATAYWSKGRTLEQVTRSMDLCTCYGAYVEGRQIGFARVLTDHVVFAYIMDVFIDPEFRGKGYSKQLVQTINNDPDMQDVQTWYLKTGDAHGLYQQFGYQEIKDTTVWMERKKDIDAKDPNRIK